MASYKEIVTKAVIGKGKKTSTQDFRVVPEEIPDTVLGCWVINHSFNGQNRGSSIAVSGTYDVNVWYSYDNDTKTAVTTKRFSYDDKMNVSLKDNSILNDETGIIVRSLKQPTVTEVTIEKGEVKLSIEKELGVEVIGDTKVKVMADDNFDDYEVIIDEEISDKDIAEIDTINEDYLD